MNEVKRDFGTNEQMSPLEKAIRTRRSVRTFDGKTLWKADQEKIEQYIANMEDPFGIKIEYRFLPSKEYGLSSPVLAGEDIYLAGKVKKGKFADVAFGYSLEEIVLFAEQERI